MSVASEPRGRFSGTEDGQRGPHRAHSGGDLQADTGLWWERDRQRGGHWWTNVGVSLQVLDDITELQPVSVSPGATQVGISSKEEAKTFQQPNLLVSAYGWLGYTG